MSAPPPVEADVPDLAARPEPGAPIGYRSAALELCPRLAGYGAPVEQALPDTDWDGVRSRVQHDPLAAHAEVVIDAAEQSARQAGGRARATLFDEVPPTAKIPLVDRARRSASPRSRHSHAAAGHRNPGLMGSGSAEQEH